MVETHAHIYLEDFDEDRDELIKNCQELGISKILMPNIDSESLDRLHQTEKDYPGICYAMIGLHPVYVKDNYQEELKIVARQLENRPYVGVGEIGVDLHWDKTTLDIQKKAFDYQIDLALEHDLPIIIHSRDSLDLTIKMVEEKQNGNLNGIFHCFNGTAEQAQRIKDAGFFMGIGGVITFKNAGVDKVVQNLSIENMVLETDAPYLSPTPYRGKRNSPAYVSIVAEKLSELLNMDLEEVIDKTSKNSKKIFGSAVFGTK